MSDETKLQSRYSARIVDEPENDLVVDASMNDLVATQMVQNHLREVADGQSTAIRMGLAEKQVADFGRQADKTALATYQDARKLIKEIEADPSESVAISALDAEMIDFAQQRTVSTKDDVLGMKKALTESLVNKAGKSIQKNIPPATTPQQPPPATTQTIVYQGPELEPAPMFTRKPKYVIKSR